MQEATPSRTAMRVAMRRAAHQIFDPSPVLDDPLATRIIGPEALAKLEASSADRRGRIARTARAFMAVRSRFAEDAIAAAVNRGARQVVVLGAGLDTFAYRCPHPGVAVLEVDHPATQRWKKQKLARARIAVPQTTRFVPVDFERQELAGALAEAGFDAAIPTFFSWLGVTMYLTDEAFETTLRFVTRTGAGGGLAFDYLVAAKRLGWRARLGVWLLSRRVARAGEPFRSSFDPARLHRRLQQLGFGGIDDAGEQELNERYFAGRSDGLKLSNVAGRVLSTIVTGGRAGT